MSEPLRVWAPAGDEVVARTAGGDLPMQRADSGWWRTDTTYDGEYWFVVDGDALPDPRSPWQPSGIRGPSHTVDHAAFTWTDDAWSGKPLASCVLYELHVGTFSPEGTFDGVITRLDHLQQLGVDAIELLPVAEFPGARGWGYDGVLLYAPHHAYGGPDGLKRLVDAAHGRGIAVVLDVVYNHLGPSGNHLGRFGPYFTDRHTTPWGDAINFDDAGAHEVRRFFADNALQWLRDYHIDGLRLDAVHAIHDESALHFLEQLAIEVEQLERATGRTRWLIAESDLNDPRLVRSRDAHGYGLDAAWSDDFHHTVHAAVTGERSGYYEDFGDLALVAHVLERTFVGDGRYSHHRDRRHGRPVDVPQDRFVCFLQNHDQIGNRAIGDRLGALADRRDLFGCAALLLLGPFVPMLFQGEEWAAGTPFLYFTDHDDPELADAVRNGRRAEFAAFDWDPASIPDPQDPETAARSRLDWDERALPQHAELEDWYRRMITLRAELHRDLVACRDDVRATAEDRVVTLRRSDALVVVVNFGDRAAMVDVPRDGVFVAQHGDSSPTGDGRVEIGPHATLVVRVGVDR